MNNLRLAQRGAFAVGTSWSLRCRTVVVTQGASPNILDHASQVIRDQDNADIQDEIEV